jgi:hypothetical protein
MHDEYDDYFEEEEGRPPDPQEERAISAVRAYIRIAPGGVFLKAVRGHVRE